MTNRGTVLVCGGIILSLSLGLRHSFGLFLQPMTLDMNWGREVFAFAIAVQNLVWGLAQPFAGVVADRYGAGRVILAGAAAYSLGLAFMASSDTALGLSLSAGILIGLGLSGTGFSVVYGAIGRTFSEQKRSLALGVAGAAGSFGQFAMLPIAQGAISGLGWLGALGVFSILAALMAPLGRALVEGTRAPSPQSPRQALEEAKSHKGFWLLSFGFLVCGFQIVFIATHLPAYLGDVGFSPRVGAIALALIGLCNVFGTLACGYLGGFLSKKRVLAALYLLRAVAIAAFVAAPTSELTIYGFAAVIGLLWLGTVPLTSGIVAQIFGVKYLSMLFGIVFLFHQVGSFLGAWLGGALFDVTGSYHAVWIIAIALSCIAAVLNWPIDERPLRLVARPA